MKAKEKLKKKRRARGPCIVIIKEKKKEKEEKIKSSLGLASYFLAYALTKHCKKKMTKDEETNKTQKRRENFHQK